VLGQCEPGPWGHKFSGRGPCEPGPCEPGPCTSDPSWVITANLAHADLALVKVAHVMVAHANRWPVAPVNLALVPEAALVTW
jgi:hypothetical protein